MPKPGPGSRSKGHARFLEGDAVGSLKVSFFGPFYGGYHIIALDRQELQLCDGDRTEPLLSLDTIQTQDAGRIHLCGIGFPGRCVGF